MSHEQIQLLIKNHKKASDKLTDALLEQINALRKELYRLQLGHHRFFRHDDKPLSMGRLYAFDGGYVPKDIYMDKECTTPHANPVILDSCGSATFFLGDGEYNLQLTDENGYIIWEIKGVTRND